MADHLLTIDIGQKQRGCCAPFGGAGSPSNTMWPGPKPSSMPSFILIHPTAWPQNTNVTDRQTGQTGQRFDSIARTVLETVVQKWCRLLTYVNYVAILSE